LNYALTNGFTSSNSYVILRAQHSKDLFLKWSSENCSLLPQKKTQGEVFAAGSHSGYPTGNTYKGLCLSGECSIFETSSRSSLFYCLF